jgi:TolB protein
MEAARRDKVLSPAQARRIIRRRLRSFLGGGLCSRLHTTRLASQLFGRSYAAGDIIIKKGVRGDVLGVVTKGQIAVETPRAIQPWDDASRVDREVLLLPGRTFGEWMLVDGEPSTNTVRAVSDAEVYFLRRADFLAATGNGEAGSVRDRVRRRWRWLAAALLLVLSVALVVVLGLGVLDDRGPAGRQHAGFGESTLADGVVQFISPQHGTILMRSEPVPIRVLVTEPGFLQAELQVDGIDVGTQVNPNQATPWALEWVWDGVSDGSHTLAVELRGDGGEPLASEPVTVTVVPAGKLFFSSNRDGAQAVYTMTTDGRGVRRLTAGPGEARQPAGRRDGSLAFVAESEGGPEVIRWMSAGSDEVLDLFSGRDPAWSPDGARLAFSAGVDGVSQVFVSDPSGGMPVQVTLEEVYAGQPAWSPDGIRLAYVAEREGNWDVWVVALEDREPLRVTTDPAMDWGPSWSPDGGRLAFVSDRMDGHQVYVMRTDGSDVQRLTGLAQGAESPTWAPDGHWLAFVAYTGTGAGVNGREIYLMRSNGEDQVRLTHNAFDDTHPDWGLVR